MKCSTVTALLILLISVSFVQAREIQLHFPHFSGHSYEWKIFQGEKELTIISGEIPSDGRVILIMPEPYQDYRGMTRWMLKKGGGLDMIYQGNGFYVECLSEEPGPDNIIYTGNPENDYLKAQHIRQRTILDKLGAINHLLQVYTPNENLHKIALTEQAGLKQAFEQVQAERSSSPLYAARFGEIVDFTRGIADKIYDTPEEHTAYFNNFVTHTLKFNDLYTSGHWDQVLHHWLMMNIKSINDDNNFGSRLQTALERIETHLVMAAFAEKTVRVLVEKGKDQFLPIIKTHLENHPGNMTQLSASVKSMLTSFSILTGKKGPDIIFKSPVRKGANVVGHDILIETDQLNADFTILLFYQGTCPLCEDALIVLANKYQQLKDQNVRVIAVSADENEQSFEKKLAYHQWPENYCDFTGLTGDNFRNYAVMGIPTLYLLDHEGIILKKSAMVDDLINTNDMMNPDDRTQDKSLKD